MVVNKPKKKSATPKAPKAEPKAPVGRPRKKLGTRVSDLPTVSTIKPMSRRSNIDSLALQRARLVYKRDYKKTISEDQARAFIDAMGAPKRGPIGERILGPRDDARLRTEFINIDPEDGQKFIQLVKRAKTGFRKDKKDKVSLKVKPDGTVVLHVPGFTDEPVATSSELAASAVPEVAAADTLVSDRHARRVQTLLIDLGRLQEALAADPTNPGLLQLEHKLQKQVRKERNVLREGYPATASTAASTAAASRRTSGRATPIAASEADIVEAMLPAEPAAPAPAAPAAPMDRDELALERGRQRLIAMDISLPQAERDAARARAAEITAQLVAAAPAAAPAAPAAVVEAALEAAPELVRQIEAEAPAAITVPTGAPRSRRPSAGPAEQADMDALLARLAELREDPGNARLLEIARLAEEREQRGPQRPPVAVSKSLRRPRRAEENERKAQYYRSMYTPQIEAALDKQALDEYAQMDAERKERARAERQAEAEAAASALLDPSRLSDAATRAARIQRDQQAKELELLSALHEGRRQREIDRAADMEKTRSLMDLRRRQQETELNLLSALHEGRREREREARAEENARKRAAAIEKARSLMDLRRRQQETELNLLSALHEGRRERERETRAEENERKAQYYRSMYTPQIEAASFAIPQPGTPVQSASQFVTAPSTTAPSGYATPAAQLERSFSELEGVPQDLLDIIEAREATSAALAEVRRQQADNERLYQERENDKAIIEALASQAQTELGPPVPVQRNIPTAADPFMQGWAATFPSANIPVPPPPPPRPPGRPPRASRNISEADLAAALAKGLKPTQGISTREPIATPREGGPPGLPPSVRSLPSEKDLAAAIKRLGKKTKPVVESGPMDKLLVPVPAPVPVPSTVNSEMAEKLRQKFEIAEKLRQKYESARGDKDDEPWDDNDVPALVEGALTNIGLSPERAKDEEFAAAMSKKFTGKGLVSKKFLKAVIKHARKKIKGGSMGGRMNDDRTDFRVLMDAMKGLRKGSGFFNGLDSVLNPVHGTPMDNKKDLADAKAAYAARGGAMGGGRVFLSGVSAPTGRRMTGGYPIGVGADSDEYKLHYVAFPDDKWTTSSSLRWLRSNGIVPIKKAMHIPEYYKYQILPPSDNKDYIGHELVSRGRKVILGYARP